MYGYINTYGLIRNASLLDLAPHKTSLCERYVATVTNNHVIMNRDAKYLSCLAQLPCNSNILSAGLKIARRMIVDADDT